ncbi:MAG: hypothetical protein VKN13_07610 [Cyanobacteriota bacterium]|nr:hypothetical protein [Cyanobacteriota bacterium]
MGQRRWWGRWPWGAGLAMAWGLALLLAPLPARAAEVLQVRGADLLQVGDHNRSYPVTLACLSLEPEQREPATAWLRQQLPRRTRVNLRPIGSTNGVLLARVSVVNPRSVGDLGEGLITAGLAQAAPCLP